MPICQRYVPAIRVPQMSQSRGDAGIAQTGQLFNGKQKIVVLPLLALELMFPLLQKGGHPLREVLCAEANALQISLELHR